MNTHTFLSIKTMLLGLAVVAALSACDKKTNDPDNPNGGDNTEVKSLVIDPAEVEVIVNETATVNITSGNGDYTCISADATIAEATVTDEVITVKGLKAGSTVITVKDGQKKAVALKVTVTASGKNNINTKVKYTITSTSNEWSHQGDSWGNTWANYKGPKTYEGTSICTKRDFDNKANNYAAFDNSDVKEFFANVDDDNIFVCAGLGYDGGLDYGHVSIACLLTDEDDAAHPGMKVLKVVASCISGYLGWEDGKYTSTPGTGYYNPSDGSFTILNSKGHLAWESNAKPFDFCADRTYTPEKK